MRVAGHTRASKSDTPRKATERREFPEEDIARVSSSLLNGNTQFFPVIIPIRTHCFSHAAPVLMSKSHRTGILQDVLNPAQLGEIVHEAVEHQ